MSHRIALAAFVLTLGLWLGATACSATAAEIAISCGAVGQELEFCKQKASTPGPRRPGNTV